MMMKKKQMLGSKWQKLDQENGTEQSSRQPDVAPPSPSDPTVKKVADKLASSVAKNARQFEDVTHQKNPGDTPFKFLFGPKCADNKYYEHQLAQGEKPLHSPGNHRQMVVWVQAFHLPDKQMVLRDHLSSIQPTKSLLLLYMKVLKYQGLLDLQFKHHQ